jgi:hypothetical protein
MIDLLGLNPKWGGGGAATARAGDRVAAGAQRGQGAQCTVQGARRDASR